MIFLRNAPIFIRNAVIFLKNTPTATVPAGIVTRPAEAVSSRLATARGRPAMVATSAGALSAHPVATRSKPLNAMRRNLIRDSASEMVVSRVAMGDG